VSTHVTSDLATRKLTLSRSLRPAFIVISVEFHTGVECSQ